MSDTTEGNLPLQEAVGGEIVETEAIEAVESSDPLALDLSDYNTLTELGLHPNPRLRKQQIEIAMADRDSWYWQGRYSDAVQAHYRELLGVTETIEETTINGVPMADVRDLMQAGYDAADARAIKDNLDAVALGIPEEQLSVLDDQLGQLSAPAANALAEAMTLPAPANAPMASEKILQRFADRGGEPLLREWGSNAAFRVGRHIGWVRQILDSGIPDNAKAELTRLHDSLTGDALISLVRQKS